MKKYKISRIKSNHNIDIFYYALSWVILSTLFWILFLVFYINGYVNFNNESPAKYMIPFFGVHLGILFTVLNNSFIKSQERLSTVDILFSDISTICSCLYVWGIIDQLKSLYEEPDKHDARLFVKRTEDYIHVFYSSIDQIGQLNREIVRDITAFYTYLKLARDATESLIFWSGENISNSSPKIFSEEEKRHHIIGIIIPLQLSLQKAYFSTVALAGTDFDFSKEAKIIKLMIEKNIEIIEKHNKKYNPDYLREDNFFYSGIIGSGEIEEKIKC